MICVHQEPSRANTDSRLVSGSCMPSVGAMYAGGACASAVRVSVLIISSKSSLPTTWNARYANTMANASTPKPMTIAVKINACGTGSANGGGLYLATSLPDALAALAERGAAGAPMAGATWIMRRPGQQGHDGRAYVGLSRIAALRQHLFEELSASGGLNLPVSAPQGERLDQRKVR